MVAAGLDPIFLISPTTTDGRIRRSAELGAGFLYVISRLGVTGARDTLADDVSGLIARVRAQSSLPVAVGFGISSPEQVAKACASADAAVVGSALVSVIAVHGATPDVAVRAGEYVRWLKSAV
jgi:tryptophan synthase alpha chain